MSHSESLHIVYVVTEQVAARYASLLRHLCVGMIDEAINVTVVLAMPKWENLFVGPVTILHYRTDQWLFRKRSLHSLLDRVPSTPSIVHCLGSDGVRLAIALADQWKAELVLQVAGFEDLSVYRSVKAADIASMPAFTEPLADRVAAEFPRKGSLVEVIRPGTHALKIPTCFTDPDHLPTLLVRSPLVGGCGLDDVLHAVARLIHEQRQIMVFIFGTGPRESAYRHRVSELKIGSQVTFAGQIKEWTRVVEGADVFIQPHPATVFDIHPLEAMAAGIAVVTCAGGVDDCFHDEQTGLVASPANADGFYRCLRRLLDDRDFARALGRNAQQYVQTHHAASSMASAFAQLYRRLTLKRQTFPINPDSARG